MLSKICESVLKCLKSALDIEWTCKMLVSTQWTKHANCTYATWPQLFIKFWSVARCKLWMEVTIKR